MGAKSQLPSYRPSADSENLYPLCAYSVADAASRLPRFFCVQVSLTSAAAEDGVVVIPDSAVAAGERIRILGFNAKVAGATNWATTATVILQGNSSENAAITMAVAALTGNAFVGPNTSNVTIGVPYYSPGTASLGFELGEGMTLIGDANGTGSTLVFNVWGLIEAEA